jgi:hypothetical protein
MHGPVKPIGVDDFLWTVIGEDPEDVIALAVEFLKCAAIVTVTNGIPRLNVPFAALSERYPETLRIPFQEVFLRARELRDGAA